VAYDIHIRTVDEGVQYPNAISYAVDPTNGILTVEVAVEGGDPDTIYFSPNYWQQYVVDPHSDDPLGFDDDDEDDDDEFDDDDEYEQDDEDDFVDDE